MKTFIRISLLAIVIVIGLCIVAAMKPDHFRVERSVVIHAPAERIFPLMNDLREFTRWSPYEGRDPAMQKTFSAVTAGRGASYTWDGNNQVGAGRMEITDSRALQQIVVQLDFARPMPGHNIVVFSLTPAASGTTASWSMEGPLPFLSRLFSLFLNFDSMIGNDFSLGLEKLKALAEQHPSISPAP